MRAPGGNAAGFTGSATSTSRRSDLPIESGAPAVKVTAGPSLRSGTFAAPWVRSASAQPTDAGNAGSANSSSRVNAAAGDDR